MKTRSILLILLIAAQLVWLGWENCVLSSQEYHDSIVIAAEPPRGKAIIPTVAFSLKEDQQFGKSLWWGEDWLDDEATHYAEPGDWEKTLAPRPTPGDEVSGAYELAPDSVVGTKLAVFWRRNADGVWAPRFEYCGSSEDTPREGEIRMETTIRYANPHKDKGALTDIWLVCKPFTSAGMTNRALEYKISTRTLKALQKLDAKQAKLTFTLGLALRENKHPLVTNLYINGIPEKEAVPMMERGEIPHRSAEPPTAP